MLCGFIEPEGVGWDVGPEVCGAVSRDERSLPCQFIWNIGAKTVAAVMLSDVVGPLGNPESSTAPFPQLAVGTVMDVVV